MGIAFFDLDGNITYKDTFLEFTKFYKGKFKFYLGLLVLSPYIVLYLLKIYPNNLLKEIFFSWFFKDENEVDVTKLGDKFALEFLPRLCFKEAIDRLKWHQQQGHRIIIITASSPIWLSGWCRQNNLELIGTQFETINGKYSGKIKGKNCYGIEKERIVKEILAKNNYIETYGYGDSKADEAFLNILKYPYKKYFKK